MPSSSKFAPRRRHEVAGRRWLWKALPLAGVAFAATVALSGCTAGWQGAVAGSAESVCRTSKKCDTPDERRPY
jgi:hypothetical protein